MTITRHPTDETLLAFAAGGLDAGRALVVATHVALCPHCHMLVRACEDAGGALLEDAEPAPMRPDAFARLLEMMTSSDHVAASASAPMPPGDASLPLLLRNVPMGAWRWIGSGVHWRPLPGAGDGDVRVFMLRAAAGTRLPHHRHTGTEWTCVMQGAFRHDLGRFGPGDFDEADASVEHKPVVEEGEACICVVALQGRVEFQGWIGRLLQPLVRI